MKFIPVHNEVRQQNANFMPDDKNDDDAHNFFNTGVNTTWSSMMHIFSYTNTSTVNLDTRPHSWDSGWFEWTKHDGKMAKRFTGSDDTAIRQNCL